MYRLTSFLGISFSFINCFISLNIDTEALKVSNNQRFDLILEHLLHLGQKCVTMETRNLKHDMTRTLYRLMLHALVFEKFTMNSRK